MAIAEFTKDEFQVALANICRNSSRKIKYVKFATEAGDSEYSYRLVLDNNTGIMVRSTVDTMTGKSRASGEDSIRAWLVQWQSYDILPERTPIFKPLGSKTQKWVTRLPGWEQRLEKVIRQLADLRADAGNCQSCNQPKAIWKVKRETSNKGRFFCKCQNCDEGFEWLT